MAYENLGGLTLISGNPKDNVLLLKSIIRKYPNDDNLWLYLAIVDYRQGNTEEAKVAIKNAYQLSQNDVNTYYAYKIINNQQIDIKVDTTPR
jgi:cytochrome c-type biogenesis protein CcmH/NrfG